MLEKYANAGAKNELERAGIIQFFEMTFELSWKLQKDYLEAQGYVIESPRDAIKQAYQAELIDDGHVWMDALAKRNPTTHIYDEEMVKQFVDEIAGTYLPAMKHLYEKLSEEK
ncbi:nucleotidyltransferase substrate binding protein [Virgibacillus siamensis]|uniref:Nucleotidyltransferase substrate binding protein n=1 Tax=Virgibacillus siamensis TaxID=480071 RepID=A0ABN1G6I1_9BACI